MMEDKQLNFNQPFLSVRRYSPPVTSQKDKRKTNHSFLAIPQLPPHLSEVKSGPVSNPGAVPFLWEQTPGLPKEEKNRQTKSLDRPPIAPKLPPGRNPKANRLDSRKNFGSTGDDNLQNFKKDTSLVENAGDSESSEKKTEDKESSESGDSDETFVDALETLSRTESYFLNCSASGLSEFDDLEVKSKPSGSFSTDPQTLEFMMNRFLPAAKAMASEMASETPQYAPKKQPTAQEQPQQLKKILMQDQPSLRYGPSFAKRYSHYLDIAEEEEEESDDDSDPRGNFSAVCGLLPQFCLKSSLSLLNPVSTMSMRSRIPISPANKLQFKSSSAGSYSETENESKSDVSEPRPVDKIQIVELDEKKTRLRTEQSQSASHNTSTYCDAPVSFLKDKEVLSIPRETNTKPKGIGSHKNGCKTFGEFLADQESPDGLDSEVPVVEKTLYVDTIQKVDESLNTISSPNTPDIKVASDSREECLEIVTRRIDQMHLIDSSLKDLNQLDYTDGQKTLHPDDHQSGESNVASSVDKSHKKCGMEMPLTFGDKKYFWPCSTAEEITEVTEKEATDIFEMLLPNTVTPEDSHQCHHEFPVPPPLPKSPSDSWLWRTLPSASKKTLSRSSYLGAVTTPQNHCTKALGSDAKWETIVKTTTVKHYHLRYSDELLTPIPET